MTPPTISIGRRRLRATIAAAGLCLSASIAGVVTQSASAGATTPTAGGTLAVAQPVDATPGSFLSPAFGNILSQYAVFETLTRISTETGEPEPVIAESWETADDGLSMTIKLRDDVTFHSGKPLTSADVVFTLQQSQDPVVSAQGEQLTQYITAIEAPSDYEVDITFSRPMPNIFDLFEILPIVNEDSFADIASGEVVDGTGPFVWASWTPGSNISLEKYADYRDADNIWLDAIDINIIGDATAQTAAIRSGRVQYLYGLSALDTRTLSEQPGYELLETGGSALPLCFDVTQPPFDNQQVRQAIHYGIDRERVLEQVQGGHRRGDRPAVEGRDGRLRHDAGRALRLRPRPGAADARRGRRHRWLLQHGRAEQPGRHRRRPDRPEQPGRPRIRRLRRGAHRRRLQRARLQRRHGSADVPDVQRQRLLTGDAACRSGPSSAPRTTSRTSPRPSTPTSSKR